MKERERRAALLAGIPEHQRMRCESCRREFVSAVALRSHAKVHTMAAIWCQFCGRAFKGKAGLVSHERRCSTQARPAIPIGGIRRHEREQVACGEFVGGYTVDPSRADMCQICDRPSREHGRSARALARRCGVMAELLIGGRRTLSAQRMDDAVVLLRDVERYLSESR